MSKIGSGGHDIIEPKRAKRTSRPFEETYRGLVESVNDVVFTTDAQGRITYVSKAIEQISKYKTCEMVKQPITHYVHPDDLPDVLLRYERALKGQSQTYEFRVVDKDGRVLSVRASSRPLVEKGRSVGLISLVSDITQRKKAEEKVRVYQEELRSLVGELSVVEERERRRIAADLHGGIGQTLALAKIKLEELMEPASSGGHVHSVEKIIQLIEQAIKYTRSLTSELSPFVLYGIGLEAALCSFIEQIQERHGIKIDFENEGEPRVIPEETRVLLFKVVRELLLNIVKHARTDHAKLSLQGEGENTIRITVEDEGIGFDTSTLNHTGKNACKGLGLYIARERLESINASFEVKSAPGCGTRVTMVAPLLGKGRGTPTR